MRVLNRPLAFILALALAAVGVIVVIEVIAVAVDARPVVVHWPTWVHWARTTQWNRAVVKVWSILLLVVGAIVLLLELKPRRISQLAVQADHDATEATVTRAGLAELIKAAVLDVDGINKTKIAVTRRAISIRATAVAKTREGAKQLTKPVTDAVQARLDSLQLRHPPGLRVRVTTRKR